MSQGEQSSFSDELGGKIRLLRETALKKIHGCAKKHGQDVAINLEVELVESFLHQIKNKMILVAIVGEGSCGKSTLVNALLRNRFLPSGIGKITGIRIFIAHDAKVHPGPCKHGSCENCPFLVKGLGENANKLCCGIKEIRLRIREENRTLNQDPSLKCRLQPLVLYTYISAFESFNSLTHCTPYLVDCPGVEDIDDDVKPYYTVLSTMVYVENYQRLLISEVKTKKQLSLKPKDATLLFAVSHFDSYFRSFDFDDEENPDEENTKERVHAAIKDVAHDAVFPVCGKWALEAHLAQVYKSDKNVTLAIDQAFTEYTKHRNLDENDKALSILRISGFEQIEKKLKESVLSMDANRWDINICHQCLELLETLIKTGIEVQEGIMIEKTSTKKEINELNGKINGLRKLEEDTQQYCSEELLGLTVQTMFSEQKIKETLQPKVTNCLNRFRDMCQEKVKNKYTFGQFQIDMNRFVDHTLSKVVKEEVNAIVMNGVKTLKERILKKYCTLITYILDNTATFPVPAQADTTDSSSNYSFEETLESTRNFVNNRTLYTKIVNGLGATVSGVIGAISVPTTALAIGASGIVPTVIFAGVSVIVAAIGAGGLRYFGPNALSTDDDMKLSVTDITKLRDKMEGEIQTKYSSVQQNLCKIILVAMLEFSKAQKDIYDNGDWKKKLDRKLNEKKMILESLQNEEEELIKALSDLNKCKSFVLEKLHEES